MKKLDYLLHNYFEFLYEKDQLGKPGGTIIGKSIDDGGAGEPVFKSKVPSGVEMTPLHELRYLKQVEVALTKLRAKTDTHHHYAIINVCYRRKEDGSKRTPNECVLWLGISERTFRDRKLKAKKIMLKMLNL